MLSQILHARRYNYAKTLISTNNKRLLTFCSMEASMSLKLGLRVGFSFQHRLMMLLNLPFGSMVSGCVAPCPTCQIRDWSGRVEKGCSRATSSYTMVLRGGGRRGKDHCGLENSTVPQTKRMLATQNHTYPKANTSHAKVGL